jgi:SAM-dependent methyltransferase
VVSFYSGYSELTGAEQSIFDEFVNSGSRILDLGVGGGRTTPYLASKASQYTGLDYSPMMIDACKRKFQGYEFRVMDASDLSPFSNESFDVVVFSFNGIDYLNPDARRWACIKECHRVLTSSGILILSVHNPHTLFLRPDIPLIRKRLGILVGRIGERNAKLSELAVRLLLIPSVVWVSVRTSLHRSMQRIPSPVFWRGDGYLKDTANPGLVQHVATPYRVRKELERFGFRLLKMLGGGYPKRSSMLSTDWFYYCCRKTPVSNSVEIRSE